MGIDKTEMDKWGFVYFRSAFLGKKTERCFGK
jgi:hypothetical protein